MKQSKSKVNGHYQISLPWRPHGDTLHKNNRYLAKTRLTYLQKRLDKDRYLKAKYTEAVNRYLSEDHARLVSDKYTEAVWFLPHHPVTHPFKPGKVRVIFDCAAKFRGTSLNDMLLSGPDLQQNLIGVLLRFRLVKFAFTSDIQVMFHQVIVPLADQKFLRFLWWPEGDTTEEREEHCMKVHIFGAKSSPSVANFALLQTAQDNAHHFNGEVLETVRTNFYVDDCLKSVNNVEEARKLINDLIELLKLGGFHLKKWLSSEPSVLSHVDISDRAHTDINLDLNSKTTENVLGVKWDFITDTLQMHFHSVAHNARQALHAIRFPWIQLRS